MNKQPRPRRRRRPSTGRCTPGLLGVALALAACGGKTGEDQRIGDTAIATPGSAAVATERAVDEATGNAPPTATQPSGGPTGARAGEGSGTTRREIPADEFVAGPDHRDPFEPFQPPRVEVAAPQTPELTPMPQLPITTPIAFPDNELADLNCRMILAMAGEKPRAYILGPEGQHSYVTQGDHVGRPLGGATEGTSDVHWRVYEIEEGGVSFELGTASALQADMSVRPSLRLYSPEEMARFDRLFLLR